MDIISLQLETRILSTKKLARDKLFSRLNNIIELCQEKNIKITYRSKEGAIHIEDYKPHMIIARGFYPCDKNKVWEKTRNILSLGKCKIQGYQARDYLFLETDKESLYSFIEELSSQGLMSRALVRRKGELAELIF